MLTDKSIQFEGFSPSEFAKNYLNNKLSLLLEEAPYGSTLRAEFHKTGRIYTGFIKICAPLNRRFVATESAHNLCQLNQRLIERISNQLRHWRSWRFVSDAIERGQHVETTPA